MAPDLASLVGFLPSQIPTSSNSPLPYTDAPSRLVFQDVLLFFKCLPSLPVIVSPLFPWKSGTLDELCLFSIKNVIDIVVHSFLVVFQSIFLLSLLPLFFTFLPVWGFALYIAAVLLINNTICWFLNGTRLKLESDPSIRHDSSLDNEYWIFVNGVSVGHHWLQSNIDRLALTFGRRIVGLHNPTSGIIFDIIQCLIQRDFSYATQDIRDIYAMIKDALTNREKNYEKVVMVLHSQGCIEGGIVIDWLLDELPHEMLEKLEVYTFGNASSHWNNPISSRRGYEAAHEAVRKGTGGPKRNGIGLPSLSTQPEKALKHIEHYANKGDFVAQWGVLHFIRLPNRFMGKLFERPGTGHLLNQHYLDYMFPLNKKGTGCAEDNEFMEKTITPLGPESTRAGRRETMDDNVISRGGTPADEPVAIIDINTPLSISPTSTWPQSGYSQATEAPSTVYRVKDFSRLWRYRNGMSPDD